MRDRVWIGQTWRRCRGKREFTVRQVHRPDRIAELAADETRLSVSFTDLRRKWELDRPHEALTPVIAAVSGVAP